MVYRNTTSPSFNSDTDTGFHTGLIETLFSLAQMCTMGITAHLAARHGRKNVVVLGLAGMAVPVVLFGFSTSVWQMVLWRGVAGVFAGYNL